MPKYGGIDLGRKHDSTAIVIVEGDEKGILKVKTVVELTDVPFEAQIAEIKRLASRHDLRRAAVDQTGMGLAVAERLQVELPGIVEPVTFTAGSKAELVTRAVSLLQDKRLRLPKHPKLREQLHSITREITTSGNLLYKTSGSDSPDLAWALLLAVHSARHYLMGGDSIGGVTVGGRDNWTILGDDKETRDGWVIDRSKSPVESDATDRLKREYRDKRKW